MEVKQVWRETEAGVLPSDWDVEPLGRHAAFRTGPFGSALHRSDYVEDGVPVINPMHIINGRIEPTPSMTVTEEAAARLSDFRLRGGDVIMGRRGEMGRCALVQAEHDGWLCGTGSVIIRPHSADGAFLQRILSSPRSIAAITDCSVGTTMVNLNQGTLAGLPIQLPPYPEQLAISTALNDVDALLDGLDRLIAKKRDIKLAVMQQLLTGRTRLPGPWPVWADGTLATVIGALDAGVSVNSVEDGRVGVAGCRILKTSAVLGGRFFPEQSKAIAARDLSRACVSPIRGSLLISRMNTTALLGECGYVTQDYPELFIPDRLWMTRSNPRVPVSGLWLSYVLSSERVKRQIAAAATGTSGTMKNLGKDAFLRIPIALPSYEEQQRIAAVVSDIDSEIDALEARRDKTLALKQGMMQELLTGRTRLV